MRRTTTIFIVLSTLIISILWYGFTIPTQYSSSRSQHFDIDPAKLWDTLADYEKYAEWRENVYAIKKLPDKIYYGSWKEIDGEGNTYPYRIIRKEPGSLLIIETIKELDTINQTWSFELLTDKNKKGVTLSITEQGEITDLLPRVITHFFTGHDLDTKAYLRSITNKLAVDFKSSKSKS